MDRGSDRTRGRDYPDEELEEVRRAGVSPGKRSLTARLTNLPFQESWQEPVQRRAATPAQRSSVSDFAAAVRPDLHGRRAGGMPAPVQRKMERAFAADFSTVTIHADSPRATQLGALAFTRGESIHFAPGQYAPETRSGQELLGHELTHVLQQREGRVAATAQAKGAAINDTSSLEQQADDLGRRAAAGEVGLYRSAALGMRSRYRAAHGSNIVQRAVDTRFGRFDDLSYHKIQDDSTGKDMGVEIYLQFMPGRNVDARAIGMTQAVRTARQGRPVSFNDTVEGRSIRSKDAADYESPVVDDDSGFHIDQLPDEQHPSYGVTHRPGTGATAEDDRRTPFPVRWMGRRERARQRRRTGRRGMRFSGLGTLGHRYKQGGRWRRRPAKIHDAPTFGENLADAEQVFETTAVAREGNQQGTYYGSVSWGWRTDAAGSLTRLPLTLVSEGVPSSTFLKSAELWNKGKADHGGGNYALPVVDVHVTTRPTELHSGGQATNLPAGTRVQLLEGSSEEQSEGSERADADATPSGQVRVRVVSGPHANLEGTVERAALRDERS